MQLFFIPEKTKTIKEAIKSKFMIIHLLPTGPAEIIGGPFGFNRPVRCKGIKYSLEINLKYSSLGRYRGLRTVTIGRISHLKSFRYVHLIQRIAKSRSYHFIDT